LRAVTKTIIAISSFMERKYFLCLIYDVYLHFAEVICFSVSAYWSFIHVGKVEEALMCDDSGRSAEWSSHGT
jgi:hypothetical protein